MALAVSGVGMLWWLRNVVLYGALQPRGYGPEATAILRGTPRPPGAEVPVTSFFRPFYETTSSRFWSGLGVPDPPTFSVPVATTLTVLTGFGVLLALVATVRAARDAHDVRPAIVLLLLPVVLLLGPLAWADLQSYRTYESRVGEVGVQGRYLYGGVAGVAVAVAVGYRRLLPSGRWPVTLALGVALVVQLYALHLVTQQFWVPRGAGLGGLEEGFRVLFDAAAWPSVLTALPFLAAAVLAVVGLVLTLARPSGVDAAPTRPPLDARL